MTRFVILAVATLFSLNAVAQDRSPSPKGAELYFIAPSDGAKLTNPVTVRFGLKGMGIAPAGIKFDNAGHHHLLIDTDLTDMSKPVPPAMENKIMHFGAGQTEVTITLPPGKHTLQLVLGDYLHIPHNPPVMSKKITVEVTK